MLSPITARKRRRSNWDRAERFLSRLRDAYSHARHFKPPSGAFSLEKGALWAEIHAQCTTSEIDYLSGYDRAMWEALAHTMEWWLGGAGGRAARTFLDARRIAGAAPDHGGFYWPGTDRPWTAWLPL